ncbi:MAG: flavodoxin family protein [Methanosarcinales archaeon]|jgi:multimeric flavodoxin WrbA|nr:flavodoxin family protein [Methanosarcinales archaeon]
MTKVTGFCGSPRKNGNTAFLMRMILEKAAEKGFETEYISLNDADIGFCEACDACRKSEKGCVKKDRMRELGEKMKDSGIWILGTPVYWWGPTAQMKVFTDRWYGLPRETFRNKKVILVIPMEDTEEKTASHVIGMYRDSLEYIGVEIADIVIAKGVQEAGAARFKQDVIEQAENAVNKI